MKLKNIFKFASVAVAAGTLLGVTSCNYLDVVPPEQAGLSDAMKNHTTALGFLYSCYNKVSVRDCSPRDYRSALNAANDEYLIPEGWYAIDNPAAYAVMRNTQQTSAFTYDPDFWDSYYAGIGQTLLFDRELDGEGKKNQVWIDEAEYKCWKAESRFCRAYYHFQLLRLFGPVPLTTELVDMNVSLNQYPGRTHADGIIDWLANEFDECAKDLPESWSGSEMNRATSVICKALKARALVLGASPLYNGSFPYRNWKNEKFTSSNPVTGENYGYELVSHEYDPAKWQRALTASLEALEAAKTAGFELFGAPGLDLSTLSAEAFSEELIAGKDDTKDLEAAGDPYVPNLAASATRVGFDQDEFIKAVKRFRWLATTTFNEGNREIIWGNNMQVYGLTDSRLPRRVLKTADNGTDKEGWNGVSPTLFTVEHFLTADGLLPGMDGSGISNSEFYKEAGIQETDRTRITNICTNREPRFYAWIGFDGGDYLTMLYDGEPKILNMRDPEEQGYGNGQRNYSVTGFLSMKHVDPESKWALSNGQWTSGKNSPDMLIRMAELYLNVAECAAWMSDNGIAAPAGCQYSDMKQLAIDAINVLRERAYVGKLKESHIGLVDRLYDGTNDRVMTLTQWARNERFIELWDEGQRYFDVRRWVAGDEYLSYGKRRGLNSMVEDPKASFLTPQMINSQYTFHKRQYLYPMFNGEVYKNPQMVQAPGF